MLNFFYFPNYRGVIDKQCHQMSPMFVKIEISAVKDFYKTPFSKRIKYQLLKIFSF